MPTRTRLGFIRPRGRRSPGPALRRGSWCLPALVCVRACALTRAAPTDHPCVLPLLPTRAPSSLPGDALGLHAVRSSAQDHVSPREPPLSPLRFATNIRENSRELLVGDLQAESPPHPNSAWPPPPPGSPLGPRPSR